ncbi:uncharacterized protein BDZ99DRAFT_463185 [Mytilinidion resinicola]|uniref:Uncharacterized protein n=1 Tax=Mytilinidion resinicola TaxID=574789 RepID=A0A6A6YN99_9PEZI|nr:uncharacterized protein BDZ99DRAFT_463185 [Mytilinidion resinicola]KAF2809347.1 hypothetical protein BDZ99DRAFT_463185 [Mytilinidion resinicola]
MPDAVELGQLVLSYPRANLQLELTASLTASHPESSIDIQQCPHRDILTLLTSKSVWVGRGCGLHLEIQLDVEGQRLGDHDLDTLTATLSDAALWSQLNLQASPKVDSSSPPSFTRTIHLDISHSRTESDTLKQSTHRIAIGVPSADIRPPDGIPVVGLESMVFQVKVGKARQRHKDKRVKRDRGCEEKATIADGISDGEGDDYFASLEEESQSNMHYDDMMLLDQPIAPHQNDLSILEDANSVPPIVGPWPPANTRSPKRLAARPDNDSLGRHTSDYSIDTITSLLDAAIRMAICKSPLKVNPGIKLKKSNFVARLADIAPSLWSPEYLTSVSQRSCLLPTVSRALSRTVYSKSRSMTLRSKIDAICERAFCRCNKCNRSHSQSVHDISSGKDKVQSIEVELWNFLTPALFDPSAARRLKPLRQREDPSPSLAGPDIFLQEQPVTNFEWSMGTFIENNDVLYEEDATADDADREMLAELIWGASASQDEYQDSDTEIDSIWLNDKEPLHSGSLCEVIRPLTFGPLEETSNETGMDTIPNSDDNLWECPLPCQASVRFPTNLEVLGPFTDRLSHLEEAAGRSAISTDILMLNT